MYLALLKIKNLIVPLKDWFYMNHLLCVQVGGCVGVRGGLGDRHS